ncbi:lipopolysaccharide biosynthesis protein [Alkalibacterium olivapovliticus]|uniref:O-antigen/teichoic acid export membrane protein n=1 Tax=Alkalibacterium olivapovliticus TaxID=99907 RepID=A0A2T0W7K9_9LACT|nr:oligosaccharide flippase family protein [Alkalibacterium olivapovliticus]PRY82673.1 O-antigen/teichoic acid export membrane protein [Alkalibacterium olivapovliticus]
MRMTLNKITKRPFIKNILIMTTGAVAAQLVSFLLQPVITRIYGPEGYGLLGVFMAIVGLLAPISTLTYPIAIVLPSNDNEARGIVHLSLLISTIITIFTGLILIFFNKIIIEMFSLEQIAPFLYLVPIFVLLAGVLQVTEQWLIRKKKFLISAKVKFYHALILNGSKVMIGLYQPVAAVLIIISVFGNGLKAILMIRFSKINFHYKINYKDNVFHDFSKLKKVGLKYNDFPLYRAPQVFLYSISQSLPILILTSFFGPASAGFYSIGKTVLVVPTSLLGKSVSDVFYPRISDAAKNGENITKLIKKAIVGLSVVGCIPFGLVIVFGPQLFGFVFGAEWIVAGEYARWMALGVFFEFINKPCVNSLPVLAAQRFHLIYTALELILRVGLLLLGYYWYSSDVIAVAFYSVSGAILNIILMISTLYLSKRFESVNIKTGKSR